MDSFGLPPANPPEYEDAQQKVSDNSAALAGVVNQIVGGAVQQLQDNQDALDKVQKRLSNSVLGAIRRNKAVIQSAADSIMAPAVRQLAANNQAVAGVSANPEIANFMAAQPVPPGYIAPDPPSMSPAQGSVSVGLAGSHTYVTASGGQGFTTQAPPPPPPPPPFPPPPPPPMTGGGYCRPTTMGGQICYTAGGRIISKTPPPPPPPPPPSPPPLSPFTPPPPPPPPPPSPPMSGGGGSITGVNYFNTVQSSGGGGGGGNGFAGPPCAGALGPYHYPPPVSAASGSYVVQNSAGYWICPGGGSTSPTSPPASPPASPPVSPPGGAVSATACPTTYTIVQGPSCPIYMAVPGNPAAWAAQGIQIPVGFTVVSTVTDTSTNVQTIVNNMTTKCIADAMKALGG